MLGSIPASKASASLMGKDSTWRDRRCLNKNSSGGNCIFSLPNSCFMAISHTEAEPK